MPDLRILVADDEAGIRDAAKRWLGQDGYQVHLASDGEEALALARASDFDLVLLDVRMPKLDGFSVLEQIRAAQLIPTVIMMSAFGDDEAVLDAIRRGAYDFLPKPFKRADLQLMLRKAIERERLVRENNSLREALRSEVVFENMIARSESMHGVFRTIRKVAEFKSSVLISGESGTGKELVARALHFHSPRRDQPFVPVNCGAIPENLLESELFGHAKGAFTDASRAKAGLFEEASHGTLFLDEISSLPLALQVKLLRVLQEGEVRRVGDNRATPIDVRVVAASIDDLSELVEANTFRQDLFYRLNVIAIHLPPLRQRREDVPLLAEHFVKLLNERLGTRVKGLRPDAMQALIDYHWPGNVRQLQNVIERAIVLAESAFIETHDLPREVHDCKATGQGHPLPLIDDGNLSIKLAKEALERELIHRALTKTGGNRTQAAKLLELSHRALLYKISAYDLGNVK
ncbi:MAG: sigma-54 dependent transcriptional regulator [Myxococcota bacterium]|jgi:two-component system response regulator AtoC|nr:sigma-54 dependent transcriptional regulator [Myxococcota bacterium]